MKIFIRSGTKQGFDHIKNGYNNQDAHVCQQFAIPAFKKTYYVGLVGDGCSGIPVLSHTEVGSNLLCLYAYRRIQELICSGISLHDIPKVLFSSCAEFLLNIIGLVMPSNIVWKYPMKIEERKNWGTQMRFKADYLASTLLGFVSDGEEVILFSGGDGILLVDYAMEVIDQDDKPEYPVRSINQPGKGFNVWYFSADEFQRVAVMTDGPQHLVYDKDKKIIKKEFVDKIFSHMPQSIMGLQVLLNITYNEHPELMKDDCTIVTFEKLAEDIDGG